MALTLSERSPYPARREYAASLIGRLTSTGPPMLDGLRLTTVPLVPEIRLHLAEDAIVLWARLEAETKSPMSTPYWASAWAGGQGLARYLLDHKEIVAGKRVLDLGSGSGVAAIAAAMAGAKKVIANDIDPCAMAAISMNAKANRVVVAGRPGNVLHKDDSDIDSDIDVVLAGDTLYSETMAGDVLSFMRKQQARGTEVFLGDPGRGHLPGTDLELLATYSLTDAGVFSDAQIKTVDVYRLAGS